MEVLMKSELRVHSEEDKTGLPSFKTTSIRGFGFGETQPPVDLQKAGAC